MLLFSVTLADLLSLRNILMFNKSDFLAIPQLDLENKLVLPSHQLYGQMSFQVKALYQDIHDLLISAHEVIALTAKHAYENPVTTFTAWYDQATQFSTNSYAQVHSTLLPLFQDWQGQFTVAKQEAGQYFQAFRENPEQVAQATFEPVTRLALAVTEQSEQHWHLFLQSPEQFISDLLAPISSFVKTFSADAEANLISSYYALAGVVDMLLAQPVVALRAMYSNTLSVLLDVYFDIISSMLVLA